MRRMMKVLGLALVVLMVTTSAFAATVTPVYENGELSALTISGSSGNDVTVLAVPAGTSLDDAALAYQISYVDQITLTGTSVSISDITSKLRTIGSETAIDVYVGETGVTTAGSAMNVPFTVTDPTPTPTPTPNTGVGITGKVVTNAVGYYTAGNAFGASVIAVKDYQVAGAAIVGADGTFTMDIAAGTYDVFVTYQSGYLFDGDAYYDYYVPVVNANTVVTDGMLDLGTITLKHTYLGDVNGDSKITTDDYTAFMANWYDASLVE